MSELEIADGGRLHLCPAPPGRLTLTYAAEVSDELGPTTWAEFTTVEGKELLDAVSSWVGTQLYNVTATAVPDLGGTTS